MPGPIQLNRVMRRYWRFAAAAIALLGVIAAIATANAANVRSAGGHHHDGGGKSAVMTCVAVGGCMLVVATAAVVVRRLMQRGVWTIPAPLTPGIPWVPAPVRFRARAGPPSLLQVLRL